MKPKLLLGIWLIFAWVLPVAVNMLFATSLALNTMWLLWVLTTFLDAVAIGLVFWMLMLRPYSRLSLLIPVAFLFAPSFLQLALLYVGPGRLQTVNIPGGGQTTFLNLQIASICNHIIETTTAGCIIYLFSLATGLQLRRGEQHPQKLEMRISSLFFVTSIMAAAVALSQFVPAGTSPFGEAAIEYFGLMNGLQYGLAWTLISWATWKDRKSTMYLAFAFATAVIAVTRSLNVWWMSDRFPGSQQMDQFTFVIVIFCGFSACLATLAGLRTIQACGYVLTALNPPHSHSNSSSFPSESQTPPTLSLSKGNPR